MESDRTLYASVLNRMKETSLTKDLKLSKIRIVQHARVPEKQVKPDKLTVIILGTLAGLGGGLLLALFHNALDRSLKTVDQTEEYLGLPVLSAIPKFTSDVAHTRNLITNADTHSSEAESFRTLRTALSMLGRKEDRKVFLFTSAVPAEGKTFCSINYALILAQQGLRTLVIDCDLRRPMVEKTLMSNNKRGFGLTKRPSKRWRTRRRPKTFSTFRPAAMRRTPPNCSPKPASTPWSMNPWPNTTAW